MTNEHCFSCSFLCHRIFTYKPGWKGFVIHRLVECNKALWVSDFYNKTKIIFLIFRDFQTYGFHNEAVYLMFYFYHLFDLKCKCIGGDYDNHTTLCVLGASVKALKGWKRQN